MNPERPDLSQLDAAVIAYIKALEDELEQWRQAPPRSPKPAEEFTFEATEPPTTLNVITISRSGLAKRTPRHLYTRRRRGGMGIFDLDTPKNNPPAILTIADENHDLLLITSLGRAFRFPVTKLPKSEIRDRGQSLVSELPLEAGETISLALPHKTGGYLTIITQNGQIRRMRHHFFGENMKPGNLVYDARTVGAPAAACWTVGDNGDIFIATRQGKALRFAEQKIPFKGCLGIRLSDDDAIVGITGVQADSSVFLLTGDGKGTLRLMSGFSANKAPGAGGKVALKTNNLTAALTVNPSDDIFIISRLSKIIRFQATEIPPKEGVVQGVNCMALRADETVAAVGGERTLY